MRYNGSFKYKNSAEPITDSETGFLIVPEDRDEWIDGCECQIEKAIPAKQLVGVDGQTCTYSFDVFIPKYFSGDLMVGSQILVMNEDNEEEEFTVSGVDNFNRKYIEIWG